MHEYFNDNVIWLSLFNNALFSCHLGYMIWTEAAAIPTKPYLSHF